MSTITVPPEPPTTPPDAFPELYRLNVAQYDQMVRAGTIGENDRVELIEGLLVAKMGRNRRHIVAGKLGLEVLSRNVPQGWHVAKEDPLVLSEWSKLEPDLAVVRGRAKDYLDRDVTAADVAMVVEIADSTLSADRSEMTRFTPRQPSPFTGSSTWMTIRLKSIRSQVRKAIFPDKTSLPAKTSRS